MKLANFVETQLNALAALEKRMAAKPTREVAERLGKATLDAQLRRIEQRIARLEAQKATALARIDAALVTERETLAVVRKQTAALPAEKPVAAPAKAKPALVRVAKATMAKAKAAKT